MSGPTTLVLRPMQALPLLMAASAIRAGHAITEAQQKAIALQQLHARQRQERAQEQGQAQSKGLAALLQRANVADEHLQQLQAVHARFASEGVAPLELPQRPAAADYAALAAYVRAAEAMVLEVRQLLRTVAASQAPDDDSAALFTQAEAELEVDVVAEAPAARTAARLLQRIAHLGTVPPAMQTLADELNACSDAARTELLTVELRRQVQLHAQAQLEQQVQEAQSVVLEQSLLDLGYQVETVDDTLFVSGGVLHFRKRHWGDYMVRLRVAAGGQSMNFNVVRASDAPGQAAGLDKTSVQDQLAEDRWCAELPAVIQALAAQGMPMQLARQVDAGELPVQQVARDSLPHFANREVQTTPAATPLARPLP